MTIVLVKLLWAFGADRKFPNVANRHALGTGLHPIETLQPDI